MSLSLVHGKLKDVIDAVATAESVPQTFAHHPDTLGATPCIIVILAKATESFVDSISNTLDASYVVRVIEEKQAASEDQTVYDRVLSITDALLDAFRSDANFTLDGNVYFLESVGVSEILGGEVNDLKVMYQDITVQTKMLKSTL